MGGCVACVVLSSDRESDEARGEIGCHQPNLVGWDLEPCVRQATACAKLSGGRE